MTQIVIDIPASLGTLVPTLPPAPQWTATQVENFFGESLLAYGVASIVVLAILLVFLGIGMLRKAAQLPEPPPYYRGPGFFQWLRESRTQR